MMPRMTLTRVFFQIILASSNINLFYFFMILLDRTSPGCFFLFAASARLDISRQWVNMNKLTVKVSESRVSTFSPSSLVEKNLKV